MNTTELYELFVHHRKISTDSRNCPFGSLFFRIEKEKISMAINLPLKHWMPVLHMQSLITRNTK